jgi:hypothetical protein
MKEIETEFPNANVDARKVVETLSERFHLPVLRDGMTHVRDVYVDTRSYYLLRHNLSFRFRRKLDNVYAGEGTRLTFKFPLEKHPEVFIREELKLKVDVYEFDEVVKFFSGLTRLLVNEPAFPQLAAEEVSKEFDLGTESESLNVAYDKVKFRDPANSGKIHTVNYLEIEDHGIGMEELVKVKDFIEEYYSLSPSTESKYRYGLRVLSLLPPEQASFE